MDPRARQPTFSILHKDHVLTQIALDDLAVPTYDPARLDCETASCEFRVEDADPDFDYRISIGDVSAEDSVPTDPRRRFGPHLMWAASSYFESCAGLVILTLLSRHGADAVWVRRAQLRIDVIPSKLQEDRYLALLQDIRRLSSGLIFDLLSKNTRSLGFAYSDQLPTTVPPNVEWRRIARLWDVVARILGEIQRFPFTGVRRSRQLASCQGTDQIDQYAANLLAAQGVDTRRGRQGTGFAARVNRIDHTFDIVEHRMIRGVLEMIARRVDDCADRARRQVRDITSEQRPVLRPTVVLERQERDQRRVARLSDILVASEKVKTQIRLALQLPFLRASLATARLSLTPIFQHVAPYRAFLIVIGQYLSRSYWTLEEGTVESVKMTSRLYEHWVFLQVVSACKASGLRPMESKNFYQQTRPDRFVLDLERDTRLTFKHDSGTIVRVRYEPWIGSREFAVARGDGVYRTDKTEGFEPDIVMEFCHPHENDTVRVVYVVVIDAKYRKKIDSCWDHVDKYHAIASTLDDRGDIALQVWIAFPSDTGVKTDREEWRKPAPKADLAFDLYRCKIEGTIGLLPPNSPSIEEGETDVFPQPVETAVDFIRTLLTFLGSTPVCPSISIV
jgi:hypothetical protein